MSEENYEGQYFVTKELGLLACHNGQNDSAFPGIYKIFIKKKQQSFVFKFIRSKTIPKIYF
jgi:hypothetical protein